MVARGPPEPPKPHACHDQIMSQLCTDMEASWPKTEMEWLTEDQPTVQKERERERERRPVLLAHWHMSFISPPCPPPPLLCLSPHPTLLPQPQQCIGLLRADLHTPSAGQRDGRYRHNNHTHLLGPERRGLPLGMGCRLRDTKHHQIRHGGKAWDSHWSPKLGAAASSISVFNKSYIFLEPFQFLQNKYPVCKQIAGFFRTI